MFFKEIFVILNVEHDTNTVALLIHHKMPLQAGHGKPLFLQKNFKNSDPLQLISPLILYILSVLEPRKEVLKHRMRNGLCTFIGFQVSLGDVRRMRCLMN